MKVALYVIVSHDVDATEGHNVPRVSLCIDGAVCHSHNPPSIIIYYILISKQRNSTIFLSAPEIINYVNRRGVCKVKWIIE